MLSNATYLGEGNFQVWCVYMEVGHDNFEAGNGNCLLCKLKWLLGGGRVDMYVKLNGGLYLIQSCGNPHIYVIKEGFMCLQ